MIINSYTFVYDIIFYTTHAIYAQFEIGGGVGSGWWGIRVILYLGNKHEVAY